VVNHAIAGEGDRFKERTIGIEIFGRDATYDTGQDAIVRVAANDVRKRLAEHYERRNNLGNPGVVQISIPHGSYVPEFNEVQRAAPPSMAKPGRLSVPRKSRAKALYAAIAGALAVVCCVLAWQLRELRYESISVRLPGILPWSMLADRGRQLKIVLADSSFGSAQEALGQAIDLQEYASGAWRNRLRSEFPVLGSLTDVPMTSVADAANVSQIAAMLDKVGYTALVQSARSVRIADLKADHPLVLLGSAYSNPWVGFLNSRLNFRIEYDPKLQRQVCINSNPRAGEQPEYVTTAQTGSAGIAYATVSVTANLQHSAYILILAGSNMEGTEAAGEFATDLPRLTETLRRIGVDPNRTVEQLELLMRLEFLSTSSGRSEIIAHRVKYRP
jgi:hypothetical protein